MQLLSSAFRAGEKIPVRYTCEGENVSPEISWMSAPANTKTFALILHDPDAAWPGGFTHWVLYNIPAARDHLESNLPKQERIRGTGTQGKNDTGKLGYVGPSPPSGTHRYFIRLYALDRELDLEPGATRLELSAAMENHVLAQAELMGTYAKQKQTAA
jgi:Raf kinase inhibitor-like YbhB/YbcL family protein